MELQHLRAFREVARELSFTRAAHNLHYSQPAVTAQIKGLEEDMGAPLFQRRGNRSVELTPAGVRLRPLAERILDLVDTAQDEIADPVLRERKRPRRAVPLGGRTPLGGGTPLGAGAALGASSVGRGASTVGGGAPIGGGTPVGGGAPLGGGATEGGGRLVAKRLGKVRVSGSGGRA
ncbi:MULTISPECIES: LysR family transcriptional regulator [unclassified Streptomyces]|uniref:LysR family transcriptional regulator n=1 Tax=unclassified Streptomyces TaxID=2593676 RepID=UPI001CB6F6ED|nr:MULTISPECIES: LysR family transcriptional regulator [unclassified Streptomyces]